METRAAGHTLAPVPLSDTAERIRFVFRARLRARNVTQQQILQAGIHHNDTELNRNALSRLLAVGVITDVRFIRDVERALLHESNTSRYAGRTLELRGLDHRGDSRWWDDLGADPDFRRPVDVIIAALALAQQAEEDGHKKLVQSSTDWDREVWRKLAYGLCRVASGHYGYAHDALTLIARLGTLVAAHVAQFILHSPLGGLVSRGADGALRKRPHDTELFHVYSRLVGKLAVDHDNPPRIFGDLRLLRRIALSGCKDDPERVDLTAKDVHQSEGTDQAARQLVDVAKDPAMPSRWRRFALWVGAELALNHSFVDPTYMDQLLKHPHVSNDSELSDVVTQLRTFRGGYLNWAANGETFDLVKFDTRREGIFDWPLRDFPATDKCLHQHTLRNWQGSIDTRRDDRYLRIVGADLRIRLLDTLHELLVHPGLVGVQSGIDMLNAAGGSITRAATEAIRRVVLDLVEDQDQHPAFVADSAIYLLGALRHPDALPVLLQTAFRWARPELQASTLWSIGDVVSNISSDRPLQRRYDQEVLMTLEAGLRANNAVAVQRAAIHAIAATESYSLRPLIKKLQGDESTGKWARWCLMSWESHVTAFDPLELEHPSVMRH